MSNVRETEYSKRLRAIADSNLPNVVPWETQLRTVADVIDNQQHEIEKARTSAALARNCLSNLLATVLNPAIGGAATANRNAAVEEAKRLLGHPFAETRDAHSADASRKSEGA